jgi:hypothetical protein
VVEKYELFPARFYAIKIARIRKTRGVFTPSPPKFLAIEKTGDRLALVPKKTTVLGVSKGFLALATFKKG